MEIEIVQLVYILAMDQIWLLGHVFNTSAF